LNIRTLKVYFDAMLFETIHPLDMQVYRLL